MPIACDSEVCMNYTVWLKYVWTKYGKTYVKPNADSDSIYFESMQDVKDFEVDYQSSGEE